MTDRTDRLDIEDTEPRCSDAAKCAKADRCARRLATIPPNTPLRNFALGQEVVVAIFGCSDFIVARERRPGKIQARRRVHPPI